MTSEQPTLAEAKASEIEHYRQTGRWRRPNVCLQHSLLPDSVEICECYETAFRVDAERSYALDHGTYWSWLARQIEKGS